MPNYIGIDLGTWMLKAAGTESSRSQPRVISLAPSESHECLPFVASNQAETGASWTLFRQRRSSPTVACGFRDRILAPDSTLAMGGKPYRGTDLLTSVLRGTQGALQDAVPDLTGLSLSVPDHWPATACALPLSIAAAGWNPILLAREWVAVLAAQQSTQTDTVICLSLGVGPARATCCALREGHWTALAQESDESLSGARLRQSLVAWLAEIAIQQVRRDPTESLDEDQILHDAVEDLLGQLQRQEDFLLQMSLFGQRVARSASRGQLAALAGPILGAIPGLLKRVLQQAGRRIEDCRVFAWGNLASVLPVQDQLQRLCSKKSFEILDPGVVARGVARLCALGAEGRLDFAGPAFGAFRRDSGCYVPSFATESLAVAFPLVKQLPVACCVPGGVAVARLIRLDGEQGTREMPVISSLRIGRDPRSDWVIDEEAYPEVSRAHTVVSRRGRDYFVADLGSMNGTYLNDRVVQGEQPLNGGDVVTLGLNGPRFRLEVKQG